MIHIFVVENYNKETLKDLLGYINTNVGRELTYGMSAGYDNDVEIEVEDLKDEEEVIYLSNHTRLQDDLCILVEEKYCKAFVNGKPILIRTYVEGME